MNDLNFPIKKPVDRFPIKIMDDVYYLLKECIYQHSPCVIAFLNGEYDSNLHSLRTEYNTNLNTLKNVTDYNELWGLSSFYVVNATCHEFLIKHFKVNFQELPTLVGYSSTYEHVYKMDQEFEPEGIKSFIARVSNNRESTFSLKKEDIKVDRIECHKITKHKNLNKVYDYDLNKSDEDDKDYSLYDEEDVAEKKRDL